MDEMVGSTLSLLPLRAKTSVVAKVPFECTTFPGTADLRLWSSAGR